MKMSPLFQQFFFYVPLLSILVAFGIVFSQYARRDRLKQELDTAQREYAGYEGRLNDVHRRLKDLNHYHR